MENTHSSADVSTSHLRTRINEKEKKEERDNTAEGDVTKLALKKIICKREREKAQWSSSKEDASRQREGTLFTYIGGRCLKIN